MTSIPFLRALDPSFSARPKNCSTSSTVASAVFDRGFGAKVDAQHTSAAIAPAIQMISATTADSKSVTIEYEVNQAPQRRDSTSVRRLSLERRQVRLERHPGRHLHAGLPRPVGQAP